MRELHAGDDHEAARLLAAYLRHVESTRAKKRRRPPRPKLIVLPEAQVADRRKKPKVRGTNAQPGRSKNPAGRRT